MIKSVLDQIILNSGIKDTNVQNKKRLYTAILFLI